MPASISNLFVGRRNPQSGALSPLSETTTSHDFRCSPPPSFLFILHFPSISTFPPSPTLHLSFSRPSFGNSSTSYFSSLFLHSFRLDWLDSSRSFQTLRSRPQTSNSTLSFDLTQPRQLSCLPPLTTDLDNNIKMRVNGIIGLFGLASMALATTP